MTTFLKEYLHPLFRQHFARRINKLCQAIAYQVSVLKDLMRGSIRA